jgi:uncharacterized protein YndB with AHSA1/START domain
MSDFRYALERKVTIRAPRDLVFRYFTDSERWARWWGPGSTIEPREGGPVFVRYPNGVEARGEIVAIEAPKRIIFTYGYTSGVPIAPGKSRVTIELSTVGMDTIVSLQHEFHDEAARDQHVHGWRFQLSLFANVVADEVHAEARQVIADWYRAWSDPDLASRTQMFARITIPDVQFRDRYAALRDRDDLVAHAGAAQRFIPGIRLEPRGRIRHCQGAVLSDWTMIADGQERGRGTNLFVLGPTNLIEWVVAFQDS